MRSWTKPTRKGPWCSRKACSSGERFTDLGLPAAIVGAAVQRSRRRVNNNKSRRFQQECTIILIPLDDGVNFDLCKLGGKHFLVW